MLLVLLSFLVCDFGDLYDWVKWDAILGLVLIFQLLDLFYCLVALFIFIIIGRFLTKVWKPFLIKFEESFMHWEPHVAQLVHKAHNWLAFECRRLSFHSWLLRAEIADIEFDFLGAVLHIWLLLTSGGEVVQVSRLFCSHICLVTYWTVSHAHLSNAHVILVAQQIVVHEIAIILVLTAKYIANHLISGIKLVIVIVWVLSVDTINIVLLWLQMTALLQFIQSVLHLLNNSNNY